MSQPSIICSTCNLNDMIPITDPDSGEMICSNCGQVVLDKIQESGPEGHSFTSDWINYSRSRTGMPTSLARHDKGLATMIGRTNKDASGQLLDASVYNMMKRLSIWDFRTQSYTPTDRNLRYAFDQLNKLKDKLGLSHAAIEKAAYIYRRAQRRGLVRGRTILAVLSAAAYIACRELGTPRTLNDIAVISNIKRKQIAKTYRLLVFELDLKIPVVDPIKYIVRVANKANLSEKTKRQAMDIMNKVTKVGIISVGKDPMGIAASVLYLSCIKSSERSISQMDIADAAGVTGVTLRTRLKDLKMHLQLN